MGWSKSLFSTTLPVQVHLHSCDLQIMSSNLQVSEIVKLASNKYRCEQTHTGVPYYDFYKSRCTIILAWTWWYCNWLILSNEKKVYPDHESIQWIVSITNVFHLWMFDTIIKTIVHWGPTISSVTISLVTSSVFVPQCKSKGFWLPQEFQEFREGSGKTKVLDGQKKIFAEKRFLGVLCPLFYFWTFLIQNSPTLTPTNLKIFVWLHFWWLAKLL